MQPVLLVDIDVGGPVFQHEDHPRRGFLRRRHHRVEPHRRVFHVRVQLDVLQQVQPEFVQPQIHNGNTALHLLNVNHFFLQAFQLRFPVFQIRLFLFAQQVVVAGGRHIHDLHAGFHFAFQINVLVQRDVRPEIDQLDLRVPAADPVDPSEPLNNADRIPVNVKINQVVAVLQVLTFGNAVRRDQHVNFRRIVGQQQRFVLGDRRKTGQDRVQVRITQLCGGFAVHRAGDHRRMQPELFQQIGTEIFIQVIGGIRKRRKHDHLFVVAVDRAADLPRNQPNQFLQFAVVLRRDIRYHIVQQIQRLTVLHQAGAPTLIFHIRQIDFELFAEGEQRVVVQVFRVKIFIVGHIAHFQHAGTHFVVCADRLDRIVDQRADPGKRQLEGIDGAFHALHQVDCHQPPDAPLTARLRETDIDAVILKYFRVFFHFAGLNKVRRGINGERQHRKLLKDLIIVDSRRQVCQAWPQRNRRQPRGKRSDLRGIVILLDMLPGPGDGDAVQHFKEVKIQHPQKVFGGALGLRFAAPDVERLLRLPEYLFDGTAGVQLVVNERDVPLIGQRQLIAQIGESVVHRRRRQHQHLRFDTLTDHLIQQAQVTVLFFVVRAAKLAAVAEIVRLVNDDKIIVGPVDPG